MSPVSRRALLTGAAAAAVAPAALAQPAMAQPGGRPALPSRATRAEILATMKRATRFMTDRVAYRGGYVWSYLPDFSRRWGELEALPTMIWLQPPGTATMGHVFLDAYHTTGDEQFYRSAEQVGAAIVAAQRPEGGWNYLHDFAGERSTRRWYATYGANAWRMEEFQHYYGNSTFDDAGTSEAMQFLLRLYVEKNDRRWRAPLDRSIGFVLRSQYPNGGWPQRYPLHREDYTSYITFNDDVAGENIKFLLMVKQTLGDRRVDDAIRRAMDCFVITQQPAPQAGWGLQHTVNDLRPAAARTYEPRAFATHTTAGNLEQLLTFYELTGDRKYLRRIPEALAWLDSVRLPAPRPDGRTHPTFIEPGTNQPLYIHRRGSNVVNGAYYADRNPEGTIVHYSSFRRVDTAALRRRYDRLAAAPVAEVTAGSPLLSNVRRPLPRYYANREMGVSDLNLDSRLGAGDASRAGQIVGALNREGWWPTPLRSTSNPYAGPGPRTPAPGDFSQTHVGDRTDTSPYPTDTPVSGISVGAYVQNMAALIDALGRAA